MIMDTVEDCQSVKIFGLSQRWKPKGGVPIDVSIGLQRVNLTSTACHFGGKRYWFLCPACSKRIGVLYRPYYAKDYFCRHCHRLTYELRQRHRNKFYSLYQYAKRSNRAQQITMGRKGPSKRKLLQFEKLFRKLGVEL